MIIKRRSVTFRYRVGRVVGVSTPDTQHGYSGCIFAEDVKEYRTLDGANAYEAQVDEKDQPVVQVGVLMWLSPEEAAEKMDELIRQGFDLE